MSINLRTLRWVALLGLAVVLVQGLFTSLPVKPRQGVTLVVVPLVIFGAAVVSLVLMPRATGKLFANPDLLLPLPLALFLYSLVHWFAAIPGLGAMFGSQLPLRLFTISVPLSLSFLATVALAVVYATWMTAAIIEFVRTQNADPCAVLPGAWRRYWRVLGLETIGWGVTFAGMALLLPLIAVLQWFALVPMFFFGVIWNLATAAVLPMAWKEGVRFWDAFREGVAASIANMHRWGPLIIAQMLLLGLLTFFYSRWSEGHSTHQNVSWNVNVFWTGGYENECRWYTKAVDAYKTTTVPLANTLLALVFGAMAVAVKISIVTRLFPPPSQDTALPSADPPVIDGPATAPPQAAQPVAPPADASPPVVGP